VAFQGAFDGRVLEINVHADALGFGDFNDAGGYGEVL
jgi:hypothetical protein